MNNEIKELERMRRKYNPLNRNEEFISIENFAIPMIDGNYTIVNGKRIPMEVYGEIIMGEIEQ